MGNQKMEVTHVWPKTSPYCAPPLMNTDYPFLFQVENINLDIQTFRYQSCSDTKSSIFTYCVLKHTCICLVAFACEVLKQIQLSHFLDGPYSNYSVLAILYFLVTFSSKPNTSHSIVVSEGWYHKWGDSISNIGSTYINTSIIQHFIYHKISSKI